MNKNLEIQLGAQDNDMKYQVIKFVGEFDKAGHSEIREQLDEAVKDFNGKILIFDFSGLKFINSEGIGYLMELHTHLLNRDMKLILVGLNAHVADVFKTIGIGEIIPTFDNVAAFLKTLQ